MAAHPLDHKGRRAVGQVLGQDGAVDAHEGLLAREAHCKHAEVALPGTSRDPRQACVGTSLGQGRLPGEQTLSSSPGVLWAWSEWTGSLKPCVW